MRPTPIHKPEAFTRIDLITLIAVIIVGLALLSMHFLPRHRVRYLSTRIPCINNLKQIGTAYRIWGNDHNDRFPHLQSAAEGGWRELLTNADQGSRCWTNYALMSNELGQSPRVLVCPSDERKPSGAFSNLVSNTNLSYFAGVSASDTEPQSLLGGDRNLGPGNQPGPDYGFSPKSDMGNDVAIPTRWKIDPTCWSLKMHSLGSSDGAGNILLGDGSAQQCSSAGFRMNWLRNADPTTNWPVGHIPSVPSIRVLFP